MIEIFSNLLIIAALFLVWKELKVISADTSRKQQLTDSLDKLAEYYLKAKGQKVVAFRAKDEGGLSAE